MALPFSNYVKAHHISHAVLVVGGLAAAIVFFAVGVGLRLLIGPVSLGPLGGTLAAAVQDALPGITLKYDQAAVEWSRDEGRVNLVILGARVFDSAGRIVAQAPKADIVLAAAPFLKGKFEIRQITLVGVQLTLVRMQNGGIRLGVEAERGESDIIARLREVISRGQTGSSLNSFAVRDARIALYDELTGLFVVAPSAGLTVKKNRDAIDTIFNADVEISGRPAHVSADFTVPSGNLPVSGKASITGLDLRALGANSPARFAALKNDALTLNLSAGFTLTPDTRIARADFSADAAGEIPIAAMKRGPLHVTSLHIAGQYDGSAQRIRLDDAVLNAREARARLSGNLDLVYDKADALGEVDGELNATGIALDLPGLLAAPVALQSASLRGRYLSDRRVFEVERLAATGPQFALETAGTIAFADGKSPAVTANGKLAALPVRDLLRYWPLDAGPGARSWINSNIPAGTIGPIAFDVDLAAGALDAPALPENALKLTFPFAGIEGNYLTGLSHATELQGSAILTGDSFTAMVDSGRIGAIALSHGEATIPKLHLQGTMGTFTVHASGDMPDILTLVDMKPLGYPTRFGVDPRSTGGEAKADLAFHVPMLHDLPIADVGISVKVAVSGFAVTLGSHTRLTDGNVNFIIDNHKLHQTGTVSLADSRLAVDWTEDFDTTSPDTTHVAVKGTLSDAARTALGLGLEDIVIGPLGASGTLTGHRGSLTHADFTLDGTPTVFSIGILGLEKPAGDAASGHVSVDFAPGNVVLDESVHIGGPNLTADGTASFNNGALAALSFPTIRMGPLNDLGFEMTKNGAERDFTLHGHSLDGSKVGAKRTAGKNDTDAAGVAKMPEGPYRVVARLDRVALRSGAAIAPFQLDMSGAGDRLTAFTLAGNLAKSAPITAKMETTQAGRRLVLSAADAGELLKGAIGFTSLKGGHADLIVNLPGRGDAPAAESAAPDYQGTFTISDFKVLNEPFFTRLFAAGSLTGLIDLLQDEGISFDRLQLDFASKNDVISVRNGRTAGPAIGATADGYVDRPKNMIALKGSLVPVYGLNSVLGAIPLIGDVLTSKKGEGVFGVTYSVDGNLDEPNVSVNPLSMLTPGILRRIFQGHIPNASNAPSNAPPPVSGSSPAPSPAPRPGN